MIIRRVVYTEVGTWRHLHTDAPWEVLRRRYAIGQDIVLDSLSYRVASQCDEGETTYVMLERMEALQDGQSLGDGLSGHGQQRSRP